MGCFFFLFSIFASWLSLVLTVRNFKGSAVTSNMFLSPPFEEKQNRIRSVKLNNTFVSKYYKINVNDIYNYLNRKKYEYIESDVKITLKFCPFCPPHKYKYDNLYKHEIFKNTGNSYCHRCGYKGSFYDFKLKMGDLITNNFENNLFPNTYEEEKITMSDIKTYNMNLLYSKEAEKARTYLLNERKLKLETLKKYYIGYTVIDFYSLENVGKMEKHECIVFPFLKKNWDQTQLKGNGKTYSFTTERTETEYSTNGSTKKEEIKIKEGNTNRNYNTGKITEQDDEYGSIEDLEVIRIKVRSLKSKAYMKLLPKNVKEEMKLFFFGDHLVPDYVDEIILTEGEIDAMTIYQETKLPVISLPNGSKSLPIYLLPYLENFKKIHLWLDFDKSGKSSVFNFVNKIGIARTNVISDSGVSYLDAQKFKEKKKEWEKKRTKKGMNDERTRKGTNISGDSDATLFINQKQLKEDKNHMNESESLGVPSDVSFVDDNILYISDVVRVKDANDCLQNNIDLRFFIKNSEKIKHSQILNFNDLRQHILEELKYPDRINGTKSKTIPSLNKYLFGLRSGELSIWTGSTGVGKTTLLSQLSLDYCIQGLPTLWGSFEINNVKLGKVMLNQFCGIDLEKNIELFDFYADKFESLPLKFLKFHGSTNLDQVIDAMDYAVYAYDVKHIIIDNLQFMLNINKFSDIYELQNIAIDKFRSFSTSKNVHITLVVHPRKEDSHLLSISSVFGSVKSTQEADNVFIIQRHQSKTVDNVFYIDIKKNRFKGNLGKIPYVYNRENMTVKEIPLSYLDEGVTQRPHSTHRENLSSSFINEGNDPRNSYDINKVTRSQRVDENFTLFDEYNYMQNVADEYNSRYGTKQVHGKTQGKIQQMMQQKTQQKTQQNTQQTVVEKALETIQEKAQEKSKELMQKLESSNVKKVHDGNQIKNKTEGDTKTLSENTRVSVQKENIKVNDLLTKNNVSSGSRVSRLQMRNEKETFLNNEDIVSMCEELFSEKSGSQEKNKKQIIVAMRNCKISNLSTIKEIREFIKTNNLNIKTAGKDIKKVHIFVEILKMVPTEYVRIVKLIDENTLNKRSNSSSKKMEKDKHMINGKSDEQIIGKVTKENEENKKGENEMKTGTENENGFSISKESAEKYIKDNIINVNDNIRKRQKNYEINWKGKQEKVCFDYFEPIKKGEDAIESSFFLINDSNFNEKINFIYKDIKYCGLDIETTGLNAFEDKIRLIQIAVENYPVLIYDMFNISNEKVLEGLREVLKSRTIIKIVQNGKFDCKFLLYNNIEIVNMFDTYIASKLLDKNKNLYGFKLSNIVEKYLNIVLDKQQQNSVWNSSLLNNNQLFYAARDSSCLLKLYEKLTKEIKKEKLEIVNDIENKCILPICDMELNGIQINEEKLKSSTEEILNELNKEKMNVLKELKDESININSQQQVLKALRDNNVRDDMNNLIENTSDSNLKHFTNHKSVFHLRNYRKLHKLYSAFYLKLPMHLNKKTNKIHTTFNQLKTFSGRFSSEQPNLQQIPRQKSIREMFIPSENHIFIIADFKQIELKIAAEITNDEIMLKAYNNNIDLHTLTASIITKKDISEVNKEDRHIAKAINFGLLYGMNYVNLKNYANNYYNLNMSLDQCLYFYNSFFEHYKGIYNWHNKIKQQKSLEYCTLSNRKTVFPYFSFTKALNYPVQGTCADILKLSLVKLYDSLKKVEGKIILCVHDEIIIETPKKYQNEALPILVQSMEDAASYFLKKVKCEVSVQIAENWGAKE